MVLEIPKTIFIIGPGGVGKTTCGNLLADKLHYKFLDLDQEFIKQVGGISETITGQGYEKYYTLNSELFFKVVQTLNSKSVFVLSSGFLTYNDDLTKKHLTALKDSGISILLLPDTSTEKSLEIVVPRQLKRGLSLTKEKEEKKFRERYSIYQKYGDIKIYSAEEPIQIVNQIMLELLR